MGAVGSICWRAGFYVSVSYFCVAVEIEKCRSKNLFTGTKCRRQLVPELRSSGWFLEGLKCSLLASKTGIVRRCARKMSALGMRFGSKP